MDDNKSPQDILNEIFEKSQAPAPPLQPGPEEGNFPSAPPPSGAGGNREANVSAKLLPWLCVVLGAALLVMGICVLQVVGMNRRLDELQNAVEAQNVDSFTQLQADLQAQTERADQAERDRENLLADWGRTAQELNLLAVQKWQRDYLFYIGQFMDNGDYPMAALVIGLSADRYFDPANLEDNIPSNQAQMEQYQTYKQKLIDAGYLWVPLIHGYGVDFSEQWDPEKNPDMAALGILWCAMEEHYVRSNSDAAAQYLAQYQWFSLGDSGEGWSAGCYPQRVRSTASDYVIQQYERLIQDLAETGWVEIKADGTLGYGAADAGSDILYGLPFTPPGQYLYGSIPVT